MARSVIALTLAIMAGALGIAAWRLFLALKRRREPRRNEEALQYEVWYVLRQKDPAAADRFLTGLWDRMVAERSRAAGTSAAGPEVQKLLETQVAEIAGAVEALRRSHAGEPTLPPALADLEGRVKRLCGDLAALEPGGTP
jgi:hypothetical protein